MRINTNKILAATLLGLCAFLLPGISATAQAATIPYDVQPLIWPEIAATAAIVVDPISDTTLYEKNADVVRPLASLSKLMTAAIVEDLLYSNPKLEKKIITIKAAKNETVADFQLKNGSKWLPRDLVKFMLIGSSNKAADNLASQLIPTSSFVSLMNYKAKAWGLNDTVFYNPSGLPVTRTEVQNGKKVTVESTGGVSTARQASVLLWKILETYNDLLDITNKESGTFAGTEGFIRVDNTDTLVKDLPIIAGKTGTTDLAGSNLAVVLQPTIRSYPHVIVIMGSTKEERFNDVVKLEKMSPYKVSEK